MVVDVRVVEEGAADYGSRGHYDPPKLWISLFSFVFLLLCQGKGGGGGTEVDTSAGRLSEAKTQRRPDSARERVRGGGFLCCFVVFVSFFEQGKRRHVEEKVMANGGDWVKRGGGLRRATA